MFYMLLDLKYCINANKKLDLDLCHDFKILET